MLAASAVRDGKVDELKKAIDERKGQPLAELPARDPDGPARAGRGRRPGGDRRASRRWPSGSSATPSAPRPSSPATPPYRPWTAPARAGRRGDRGPRRLRQGIRELLPARAAQHDPRRCWPGGSCSSATSPAARKRLEAYIEAMEKNASRYSGDYCALDPQAAVRAGGVRVCPGRPLDRRAGRPGPIRRHARLFRRRPARHRGTRRD